MLRVIIRPLLPEDWTGVEAVYRQGIEGGNATFEDRPPATWGDFDRGRVNDARLVAVDDHDRIQGWVAASPVSARAVYAGVIEHSVYVATAAQGSGIGGTLLRAFLTAADDAGYWTVQASIFPENTASLALHARAGFRIIGGREAIARMGHGPHAGRWRDTLLVERRSALNGCDEATSGRQR